MVAEEVLGITIANEELSTFETLDDVQLFIKRKAHSSTRVVTARSIASGKLECRCR